MVAASERLFPGPVAVEKVTGERPHYSTFFRWTQRGIRTSDGRRIRLEFVKAGSKRLTSVEAVRRFFRATTEAAGVLSSNILPEDVETIDDQLVKEGL
ncbi:MAG: DUF1580 domain-containing protein [Planctomycetes bacterium]|nr:DUF1580 domain-containing protein [Planctomycetota bacterium]